MKVLQLLSSTGLFGAENVVMELIRELKEKNIETFLGILENKSNTHYIIAEEAKRYIQNVKIFPCNGKFDIRTIWDIKKFLEVNNINLIHSHKYKTNFYSLISTTSKNIPLIATCHNWLSGNYKMKMYEWLDKKILNKFDRVVTVSDEVKDKILRSGVPHYKVLKIKNGINLERYSKHNARKLIRAEFKINNDTVVIGNIGRLDRNKGVTYLLKAGKSLLNEFKNVLFLIVGEGSSKQELLRETNELGIGNRVIFTGFRNDIPSILSAIDIFVLPSLEEGLPMVILEAMASKKPVVATKVGDIPNVITHNESGLLIDPGDINQLKEAIGYFIRHRDLSNVIAQKGFEKIKNEYSSKQMTEQYIEIYNDVLQTWRQSKKY